MIEILGQLEIASENKIVLIGGQAVAIWGDLLRPHVDGPDDAPVTSRDVDFQGTSGDARRAAELLGGDVSVPEKFDDFTPNSGVVRFVDAAGNRRTLDFVDQPFGLGAEAVQASAQAVELSGASSRRVVLWVMHPRHCLESRVHNTGLPGRNTELAKRQLVASVRQANAFVRLLLEAGEVRAAGRLNELMFRFALRNRRARDLAFTHDVEVFDAVANGPRFPEAFRTIRYPQMKVQINDRRAADRRHRERTAS